jgi:hypothetical protein
LFVAVSCTSGSFVNQFKGASEEASDAIANEFRFNGYTNHWQNVYRQHYRYGNLYRINVPDLEKTIAQSKIDLAEKLGIPGLNMQEGFFNSLAAADYTVLENPSEKEIRDAFKKYDNVLVYADRCSELGQGLGAKAPAKESCLSSYQTKAEDYTVMDAFVLKNRKKSFL